MNWIVVISLVFSVLFLGLLIYLTFPKICRWILSPLGVFKGMKPGEFNNLLMPLLTVGAITTTFAAFMVQSEFNRSMDKKVVADRAEKMVFEFINMHNRLENSVKVTEHVHGKRAFHFMYYEYMSLQHVMNTIRAQRPELLPPVHTFGDSIRLENEVTMIIFRSFYYGISSGNNKALVSWVHNELKGRYDDLLTCYRNEVCRIKELNDARLYNLHMANLRPEYYDRVVQVRNEIIEEAGFLTEYFMADERFLYADGHMPNLDSHMRLLKTILTHFNKLKLPPDQKGYYLDLLRSQLSSHELVVGALYCVTDTDFDWFKEGFLSKTQKCCNDLMQNIDSLLILKSVPRWHDYVRSDITPLQYFDNVERYKDMRPIDNFRVARKGR